MDPVSLTASIIAVLQLTTTLISYINDTKNAPKEQANLAVEAGNLYALLIQLRFRVEEARSNEPWCNQVKLLGTGNGPLRQFKIHLEALVDTLPTSSGKRAQIKSALGWKFAQKEVQGTLARIERLKSLINLALMNDLASLTTAINNDLGAVKEQTERLGTQMAELHISANQNLQNSISRWLGVPDSSVNYHAALQKRTLETGRWLLNDQRFKNWEVSTSSLIWLHGKAGCGKTILSATALQYLLQRQESVPNMKVSYFYFDFNDAQKQLSSKAIRSLLFQFAVQNQETFHDIDQLYQECNCGQQQPAEESILSLLKDVMTRPADKYIVLDALDECSDRDDILTAIQELTRSNLNGLRILATSRREKDIEDEMANVANHSINIQSAIVDEDIRIYIHAQLSTDKKLKKWSESVHDEITAALMKKADGMYGQIFAPLERDVLTAKQVSVGVLSARVRSPLRQIGDPQKGAIIAA